MPSFLFDSFSPRRRSCIRIAPGQIEAHPYLISHLKNLSCQVSKESNSWLIVPLEDFREALRLLQARAIPYTVHGEGQLAE
jgi:hypothetical protein